MALAIYRKYRPLSFKDVLGQELVTRILQEAARQDKLSHAYLFTGPRGTGKTTTARLIAKIANCKKRAEDPEFRKKGEPCNKCSICTAINEGRNLDIIEIDAASNRGIDEIRNLKESIRVAPSEGNYKIYIIDEAHMLTTPAFNALLKTLEEPPSYIIVVLATTEAEKIPATITSRTQQFHFKRVSLQEIVSKLKTIAKKEKIKISDEALELIASAAEGSFRDAESLLDQLVATGDKEITVTEVEAMVGKIGFDSLSSLAEAILKGDLDAVLQQLSEIQDRGYDITQFTKDLLHYLRRVGVLNFSPQMKKVLSEELTKDHLKIMETQAQLFEQKHLSLIKDLITAYSQMRYSQFPIIPLEVTLISFLQNS